MAVLRRHPTCSFRKIAASAVTTSGAAWLIEVRLAIGMWTSAVMNRIVAIPSVSERSTTLGEAAIGRWERAPLKERVEKRMSEANIPRQKIKVPTGSSDDRSFISVSLDTNPAIAMAI
jgi:hypothetical protein